MHIAVMLVWGLLRLAQINTQYMLATLCLMGHSGPLRTRFVTFDAIFWQNLNQLFNA